MSPGEILGALDEAIANTPRRRSIALALTTPGTLGQQGKRLHADGEPPAYGYTRRQCERMRELILAAARQDADAARRQVHGG